MSLSINVSVKLTSELLESERRDILGLFKQTYRNYHYYGSLFENNKVHFLAYNKGEIRIGYGSCRILSNSSILSNLIVHHDFRNLGISKIIDKHRIAYSEKRGLPVFVSCVTDQIGSIRNKLNLGMQPICIRYGYRKDTTNRGYIGNSMVFMCGTCLSSSRISNESFYVSRKNGRTVGYVSNLEELDCFRKDMHREDGYCAVITKDESVKSCLSNSKDFEFCGYDFLPEINQFGLLFQLKNKVYNQGFNLSEAEEFVCDYPINYFDGRIHIRTKEINFT